MRRWILVLPILLLLLAISGWWMGKDAPIPEPGPAPEVQAVPGLPAVSAEEPTGEPPVMGNESVRAPALVDEGSRASQAFRFVMDEGKLTLQQIDDLQGGWRERRGDLAWWPGMLYYRLLDSDNQVIAEETQPAPDQRCVVLDPRQKGPDGKPLVMTMTADGPVLFQVRLPKDPRASILKIYRLTGPRAAGSQDEPAGELLSSVSIPK